MSYWIRDCRCSLGSLLEIWNHIYIHPWWFCLLFMTHLGNDGKWNSLLGWSNCSSAFPFAAFAIHSTYQHFKVRLQEFCSQWELNYLNINPREYEQSGWLHEALVKCAKRWSFNSGIYMNCTGTHQAWKHTSLILLSSTSCG